MYCATKTLGGINMTQLNLNLNLEEIEAAILESNMENIIKSSVILMLNQYMENERDAYLQAEAYERNDTRVTHRNGYYERDYTLAIGKITLKVPRTRDGKFSTTLFDRYQRTDKAFILSMMEMVVQGVSTRRVTKIVEELIGETVSASFISTLMKRLDPLVNEWANRKLDHSTFAFLYVDAMYIKVRENRKIVSKAVYVAAGLRADGKTEIIGFKINSVESYTAWKGFLQELKDRGLNKPEIIISDAHEGLKKAISECFLGTGWQRCLFHFTRNIFTKLPKKGSETFRRKVTAIFNEGTLKDAKTKYQALQDEYSDVEKYEKAMDILEQGFDEVTQYYQFKPAIHRYIRTTNRVENINLQIRRREKVIRIFPNHASATRLIGATLMDLDEEMKKKLNRFSYKNLYVEE